MPVMYKFASGAIAGLYAFADDRTGTKLPEKHGPWRSTGNVQPNQPLPHKLDRDGIEQALSRRGYQMWRMKKRSA